MCMYEVSTSNNNIPASLFYCIEVSFFYIINIFLNMSLRFKVSTKCKRSSHDLINVIIAHFLLIFADHQQAEVSIEQTSTGN